MDLQDKPWGHKMVDQPSDTFRIGLLNPGGIPVDMTNVKTTILKQYVTKLRPDAIGIIETNVHWKGVPVNHRLQERTMGWWESININTAYYDSYKSKSPMQPGGVTLWSINKGAHRVTEQGQDTRGLGRWAWTRYKGRNGVAIRYVAAYRPVLNKNGLLSVWSQQRSYFDDNDEDRCPREMFTIDLCAEIVKWQVSGDQVIIGLDANEDVRNGDFSRKLARLGLTETITAQHGNCTPATYKRGSIPIDGLYVSSTLRGLQCGYLAFEEQFDHRCLWMDIPLTIAFGHSIPAIVTAKARRLKCEDPRIVRKYQDTLRDYLAQHNLLEEAQELQRKASYPCTSQHETDYNRLDQLRVEGMMEADKKCRKLTMGAIQYTPAYSAARTRIELWSLVVKKLRGGIVDSTYLRRKAKSAKVTDPLGRTLEEALEMRTAAYQDEKRLAKASEGKRQSWLETLAEARAEEGNLTQEQEIKNMLRREEQRKTARIIKRVNGKLRSGSVTSVVAPNSSGEWEEVTTKEGIEKALLEENERRFNQARDTPFLVPPLADLVGPLGTGPMAEAILQGNFMIPAGVDPWAAKLIPHLARPKEVAQLQKRRNEGISTESHCDGWRKAKERTASGRSGITFAHFKAGADDDQIAAFETIMTSIPYETGISPRRWQQGIDVMLEKKKGNYRVDKLRAILLYEADFNQNNKKIGRDMMYLAEDLEIIAREQYGSRKNFSAVDHSLNKTLTFDLIRQNKRPGALCANDAKSCYDRIVHSVASLAMQRMGVDRAPIVCMFTTIQKLEHYIRTIYGDSEYNFSGKLWTVPIQGVGQGNGAGPQIWAVVSTPVLNMLRAEGYGAFFASSLSNEKVSFVGYAFVDDTDLVTTSKDPNATYEDVAELMQGALTAWEGGIRATGGAIEPEKSHWYLIDFVWHHGKWRYATVEETPAEISVKDCNGKVSNLQRLSVSEAKRTLGVRIAPDGNNGAEMKFLKSRVDDWAERIRTGHLPRHISWQSMNTTIMRSIMYPLPATTMTEEQCEKIMGPMLKAGLSSAGVVRTLPRALVYGPKYYQGLGIPCLYTQQEVDHIERILKFCQAKSNLTGQLIRQSVEATKLEIGFPGSLFSQSFAEIGKLATATWATKTWQFVSANGMRIEDKCGELLLSRERDKFLMPAFLAAGYEHDSLSRLNGCRLYLQVVSVAEIATGCGKYISSTAWSGQIDPTRTSAYQWPAQGKPADSDWNLWRQAVTKTFCRSNKTLRQELGKWIDSERTQWSWFFDQRTERLYQKEGEQIHCYPRAAGLPSRAAVLRFREPIRASQIPATAVKATVAIHNRKIALTGYAATVSSNRQQARTLKEWVETEVHEDARWAIKNFIATDEGTSIAAAIKAGECTAVSDGSFKQEFGTACWTIQGNSEAGRIYGPCVTPGNKKDQSAYRSELSGLYGIAIMVEAICKFHQIEGGHVEVGCDGLQALRYGTTDSDITNPKYPQYDIIAATRQAMRRCPIKWTTKHVKGHQDDNEEAQLDRWAVWNIEMDEKAKAYWYKMHRIGTNQHRIYGEPWAFWIGETKICKAIGGEIVERRQGAKCLSYWNERGRFGEGSMEKIDWIGTGQAMKAVAQSRQRWVTKHVSGFCATGKMMKRWKKRDNARCPRCDKEEEDAEHVWLCQGEGANDIWDKSIERLLDWMKKEKTYGKLAEVICDHLSAWRYNRHPTIIATSDELRAAIAEQRKAGWRTLLEGAPVKGWREIQQSYLERIGSRKTGLRWITALIVKLWDVAWDQWNHRNGVLHDKDSSIESSQQVQQIREQFLLGSNGMTADGKRLMRSGQQQVIILRPEQRAAWLIRIIASRARGKRQQETMQTTYFRERQGMATWLAGSRGRS